MFIRPVIQTFAGSETERFYTAGKSRRLPPSNRLEQLHGDRAGLWSMRINDQRNVCFRFKNGDASEVEIVDCH
mgnify:CR=1 FL=1